MNLLLLVTLLLITARWRAYGYQPETERSLRTDASYCDYRLDVRWNRSDCGQQNRTKEWCVSRGCCWDPNKDTLMCFYPNRQEETRDLPNLGRRRRQAGVQARPVEFGNCLCKGIEKTTGGPGNRNFNVNCHKNKKIDEKEKNVPSTSWTNNKEKNVPSTSWTNKKEKNVPSTSWTNNNEKNVPSTSWTNNKEKNVPSTSWTNNKEKNVPSTSWTNNKKKNVPSPSWTNNKEKNVPSTSWTNNKEKNVPSTSWTNNKEKNVPSTSWTNNKEKNVPSSSKTKGKEKNVPTSSQKQESTQEKATLNCKFRGNPHPCSDYNIKGNQQLFYDELLRIIGNKMCNILNFPQPECPNEVFNTEQMCPEITFEPTDRF